MSHRHPIIAAVYDRLLAGEERDYLAMLRQRIVGRAPGRLSRSAREPVSTFSTIGLAMSESFMPSSPTHT
jgi:hypothetical protein